MSHVFISYSSEDKDYADQLAEELKRRGFNVWMDYQRLPFNEAFFQKIAEAIRECGAFVVLMSPNSAKSRWVRKEMHLADDIGKPIFPILIAGIRFDFLVEYNYADCLNGNLPLERWYTELATWCLLGINIIDNYKKVNNNYELEREELIIVEGNTKDYQYTMYFKKRFNEFNKGKYKI